MWKIRESLWLPAAVLAIGVALMIAVLSAADRAAPVAVDVAAYPVPPLCLFLPLVNNTIGAEARTSGDALGPALAATAYPPPGPCIVPVRVRLYLPIIYR
jgi:hypothetical protein